MIEVIKVARIYRLTSALAERLRLSEAILRLIEPHYRVA
jgi:hypothetical protein